MRRSIRWLASAPAKSYSPTAHLSFIIPVINEQDSVAAAAAHFSQHTRTLASAEIVFVTTGMEDLDPYSGCRLERQAAISTAEVIDQLIQAHPDVPIRRIHFTGDGRKAAQVNLALRSLAVDADSANVHYAAVFDIDSRPSVHSVIGVLSYAGALARERGNWPTVLQQSALFFVEGDTRSKGLVHAFADLQSLWTLRREIPALRRYSARVGDGTHPHRTVAREGLAQTVGHGLYINVSALPLTGPLPEYTTLDDLPFGFQLTSRGRRVDPVPHLTTAAVPTSLGSWVRQGQRWFVSYLEYSRCFRVAATSDDTDTLRAASALLCGWYRGFTWLLRGPLTMTVFVALVRRATPRSTRMLAAVSILIGFVEPIRLLRRLDNNPGSLFSRAMLLAVANFTSSIGPFRALAATVRLRPGRSSSSACR